jgi:hypothetical protein
VAKVNAATHAAAKNEHDNLFMGLLLNESEISHMDLNATTACRFPGNVHALPAAVKAGFAAIVS